jgi:murein DD-endopeptidase MepM/ murein hydrolase activator NlpD
MGRGSQLAVAAAFAAIVGASIGTGIALGMAQRADALSVPMATAIEIPVTQAPTHVAPARPVMLWDQMAALEMRLATEQDRLNMLENEIRRILGNDLEPVGVERAALRPARIAWLLAAHRTSATAYQQCLESEYTLYRRAADDAEQARQLLAGAEAAGDGAGGMVAYNLQVVQTQLAQERAISRAEALLARYHSSLSAQLRGIARQPFIAPESGQLTQGFGPSDLWMEPPLTYRGIFHPHFHTGIDLAAPLDTPLQAAADGVVLLATASLDARGHLVGYGNYVLVAHPDGFATLYGHLSRVLVMPGDVVRQGEVIGLEGSTGMSTGPHVHFEIRQGHELLDPLPLLVQPAA